MTRILTVHAPRLVALILGLALIAQIFDEIVRLRSFGAPDVTPVRTRPFPALSAHSTGVSRILSAHLFGSPDPEDAAASAVTVVAAGLQLTGVTLIGNARGYAIIRDASGTSHLYEVGNAIGSGRTLQAIYPNYVVLAGSGRDEKLPLLRLAPGKGSSPQIADADVSAEDHTATGNDADASAQRPALVPRVLPTSGAVLRSMELRPVLENGQRVGMRVAGSPDAGNSLAALGLDAGDVIVGFNGTPVAGGAAPGGQLMASINEGQAVTLSVQRDGQVIDVTIDPQRAGVAADIYRRSVSQ